MYTTGSNKSKHYCAYDSGHGFSDNNWSFFCDPADEPSQKDTAVEKFAINAPISKDRFVWSLDQYEITRANRKPVAQSTETIIAPIDIIFVVFTVLSFLMAMPKGSIQAPLLSVGIVVSLD